MTEKEKISKILQDSNYSVNVYHDQDSGDLFIYDGSKFIKIGNRPAKESEEDTGQSLVGGDWDDEIRRQEAEERREILERERQEAEEAKARGEAYDEDALHPFESEEDVAKRKAAIQKIYDDEEAMADLVKETDNKRKRYSQKQNKIVAKGAEQKFSSKNVEFQMDLEQFIKGQIKERRQSTWQKPNMSYEGTGIIRQGKRNERKKTIPRINVYFDQSGSWHENDVKNGQELIGVLNEYVDRGQLSIELFYFADHIHTDAAVARAEGGTGAGAEIVEHILDTEPDNVIIMTDSDINEYGGWDEIRRAPKITVPGARWCLFRGSPSPTVEKWIQGERHNATYMI